MYRATTVNSRGEANRAIVRFVVCVDASIRKVPQSRLIALVLYSRAGFCNERASSLSVLKPLSNKRCKCASVIIYIYVYI